MDEGFLHSCKQYLTTAPGSSIEKAAVMKAAEAVASCENDELRKMLTPMFWAWLQTEQWKYPVPKVYNDLESGSHLDAHRLKELYHDMPRYTQAKAETVALEARKARVRKCREHIALGWPMSDCVGFCYTLEEYKEAGGVM